MGNGSQYVKSAFDVGLRMVHSGSTVSGAAPQRNEDCRSRSNTLDIANKIILPYYVRCMSRCLVVHGELWPEVVTYHQKHVLPSLAGKDRAQQ